MSQEAPESQQHGQSDFHVKPVVRPPQLGSSPRSTAWTGGTPAAPTEVSPQPIQTNSADLSADAVEAISGAPIRLQGLREATGTSTQRAEERSGDPHVDQGHLPRHGSNPLSARRSERVVTYIEPDLPSSNGDDGGEGTHSDRIAIGNAAERAVVKYELEHDRTARRMHPGNPGYDVYVSQGETPDQERYIEVKGTDGEWDRMGVGLTKPQFEMARDSRQFWLYVVEWARTENPKVYAIPDPYSRIGHFRFDNGWKCLAESPQSAAQSVPPTLAAVKVGDRVQFTHAGHLLKGVVRELKGALKLIVIESDIGELIEKLPTCAITVLGED
jgi:Domain of unknown function (DUF3883)